MRKVYIDMILGITGAFGCGKSSVLAVFAARNWRTADADRICHRFYAADGPLPGKLVERWGKTILLDSGEVDRGKLAAIVFADPAELDALTAMVYPLLADELDRLTGACRRDGIDAAIEIPLLYEADLAGKFDAVAAVWSAPEIRRERLRRKRNFDDAEIRRREARQLAADLKLERADYGLINNGPPEELERQINLLINQFSQNKVK